MIEDRKEFGVIKSTFKQEVNSYLSDLYNRSLDVIDKEFIPQNMFKRGDADVFDRSYRNSVAQRNLPHALAFKSAYKEALNTEAKGGKFVVTTGAGNIKNRLEGIIKDLESEAFDYIEGSDLSFLESMSDEELKQQLAQAYKEDELGAVIFYVSLYSLKNKMKKITNPAES